MKRLIPWFLVGGVILLVDEFLIQTDRESLTKRWKSLPRVVRWPLIAALIADLEVE